MKSFSARRASAPGDDQPIAGIRAQITVILGKLGLRDGRDLAEREDLAVRVVDRGPDHLPSVLEHEHVVNVAAGAKRRGARRPQLDNLGRPRRPQQGEGSCVVCAVQDHLVASVGRPGQRFGMCKTSYGSGASSPPGQNGHTPAGRLGRCWRHGVTTTQAPVSGSIRTSASLMNLSPGSPAGLASGTELIHRQATAGAGERAAGPSSRQSMHVLFLQLAA